MQTSKKFYKILFMASRHIPEEGKMSWYNPDWYYTQPPERESDDERNERELAEEFRREERDDEQE